MEFDNSEISLDEWQEQQDDYWDSVNRLYDDRYPSEDSSESSDYGYHTGGYTLRPRDFDGNAITADFSDETPTPPKQKIFTRLIVTTAVLGVTYMIARTWI